MKIDVITVFPDMFRGFFGESMLKRAVAMGAASIRTVDLRDFATDRRRTVDDKPYSGGPGMLMKLLVNVIVVILNYVASKLLVFRNK